MEGQFYGKEEKDGEKEEKMRKEIKGKDRKKKEK
jgi:hypothetical protein